MPSATPTSGTLAASRDALETLHALAGARSDYPREKTVAQLFEEAAARHPENVALIFGTQRITYRELNRRANHLAHRLRRLGAGPEILVAVCAGRSVELVVALVAILKAGAAYLPLDPDYPRQRIAYMLADTRAPIVLAQREHAQLVAGADVTPLYLDEDAQSESEEARASDSREALGEDENPPASSGATSLAYVMYTSGSTGQPKGVAVENRAIVRLVSNANYCRFGPEEVFLQFAPVSFDASTFEIWGALLHGATLVLMPPGAASLDALGRAIADHGVTALWLTAGLFHLFVDERLSDLRPLRQLLAGGDALSARHVRRALEALPNTTLINGYGPTEGTTFTCCHAMRAGDTIPESVPLGKPVSNTRVYILDEQMQPLPAGEAGELIAAGDGVARGYRNAPELTVEKFLPDPFSAEPGARMYRTGDMARWSPDGTIEFLGRRDTQVKILGHRVELGEIEAALGGHRGIRQVCVAASADEAGTKRLAAYYVASSNDGVNSEELVSFLAARLPGYMVPAFYVRLEALPLTPNGKVDRAALPSVESVLAAAHAAPQNEAGSQLEEAIAGVWRRVLRNQDAGLDENFFDLGGDSLLLVAVHSQLQKLLGVAIEVTDLFEYTTVRALAKRLGEAGAKPSFSAVQQQAQKQREAFARLRVAKGVTP